MRTTIASLLLAATLAAGLTAGPAACSTAPKSQGAKDDLNTDAQAALARFKREDPSLADLLDSAHGYAIFPTIGKGGIGIGGAYGRGQVYEQGTLVGYCDLSQGTIGLQLGGQSYAELIVFETKAALDNFKSGDFAFAAQATAVALKSGAAANAKYADGVAVFTSTNAGLMYEASIGGQKFSYRPI